MTRALGLILAAGRGRRVGGPKAFLEIEPGRTALDLCADALLGGGVERVRVVVAPDAPATRADVERVENADPRRGQTSSIRAGLAAGVAPADAFLLLPVDLPLVTAADVRALLDAWETRVPGVRILAPSVGGRRGHPVVFEAPLAAEFAALADDEPGHRVVRRDAARVAHLDAENPWLVRDVDDPATLAEARAVRASRRP